MAMSDIQKYAFYNFISAGDGYMKDAELNLSFKDISSARNQIWHAISCYEKAVELATDENDVRAEIARRDLREARNKFEKVTEMQKDAKSDDKEMAI